MPMRPFRFVHATNLRLDQPLWGVGKVAGPARRIAEDATLKALQRIVAACIDHHVSCLLLTGNSFDAIRACRARMALENACEDLAAHGIEVFIVPGETDPAAAWTKGLHLPPNVTVFTSRHSEPVAVVRDSEVLATVEPYEERSRQSERTGHPSALQIGLLAAGQHLNLQSALLAVDGQAVDEALLEDFPAAARFGYLALGNGSERLTVDLPRGIAHDPGCPQPLDGREIAGSGCSLVEIDRAGQLHVRQIPTAVVGRDEIHLKLPAGASWDELSHRMQTALMEREPLSTEELRFVHWIVECDGSLAHSLMDGNAQNELCELVEQELADDRDLIREHAMEIRGEWIPGDEAELTGSLFEEFTTLIDEHLPAQIDRFRRHLPAVNWPEASWVRHIIDAGERVTPGSVRARARDVARHNLLPIEHGQSER